METFIICTIIGLGLIGVTIPFVLSIRNDRNINKLRKEWLEEEKKKPKYVIEVDTEVEVLISNPFEPSNNYIRRTSRGNAIYRTTNMRSNTLEIEVGEDYLVIPKDRIISMKIRPEFEDE